MGTIPTALAMFLVVLAAGSFYIIGYTKQRKDFQKIIRMHPSEENNEGKMYTVKVFIDLKGDNHFFHTKVPL